MNKNIKIKYPRDDSVLCIGAMCRIGHVIGCFSQSRHTCAKIDFAVFSLNYMQQLLFYYKSMCMRKPTLGPDQVRHKPACASTEDG